MGQDYQQRDFEIVDYQLYRIPGIRRPLRGPRPRSLKAKEFAVFLGAAQTFGCYCDYPFPRLLGDWFGFHVVNFGVSGAGPAFFYKENYLSLINKAGFAVVQVMSGRSVTNSRFIANNGRELLTDRASGEQSSAMASYKRLFGVVSEKELEKLVLETRRNYVHAYQKLLKRIEIPKMLFWFSERDPAYQEEYTDVFSLFGKFPQFVNREMVTQLAASADAYVECTTNIGMPQQLISRFSGEMGRVRKRAELSGANDNVNNYYPSPQMHRKAFESLKPVVGQWSERFLETTRPR